MENVSRGGRGWWWRERWDELLTYRWSCGIRKCYFLFTLRKWFPRSMRTVPGFVSGWRHSFCIVFWFGPCRNHYTYNRFMEVPRGRSLRGDHDGATLVLENWSHVISDVKPKSGVDLLYRESNMTFLCVLHGYVWYIYRFFRLECNASFGKLT